MLLSVFTPASSVPMLLCNIIAETLAGGSCFPLCFFSILFHCVSCDVIHCFLKSIFKFSTLVFSPSPSWWWDGWVWLWNRLFIDQGLVSHMTCNPLFFLKHSMTKIYKVELIFYSVWPKVSDWGPKMTKNMYRCFSCLSFWIQPQITEEKCVFCKWLLALTKWNKEAAEPLLWLLADVWKIPTCLAEIFPFDKAYS